MPAPVHTLMCTHTLTPPWKGSGESVPDVHTHHGMDVLGFLLVSAHLVTQLLLSFSPAICDWVTVKRSYPSDWVTYSIAWLSFVLSWLWKNTNSLCKSALKKDTLRYCPRRKCCSLEMWEEWQMIIRIYLILSPQKLAKNLSLLRPYVFEHENLKLSLERNWQGGDRSGIESWKEVSIQ